MIHALACPIRARWRRRHYRQPFWRDDKVAQTLGIARFGCWRCGRRAIAERDEFNTRGDARLLSAVDEFRREEDA